MLYMEYINIIYSMHLDILINEYSYLRYYTMIHCFTITFYHDKKVDMIF
jgi:hypothetical protein